MLQRQRVPRQGPPAPRQRGQAFADGRVAPRDGGGVDHPVPVCTALERLDPCGCPSHEAARDVDNTPRRAALDDLGDARVATRVTVSAEGRTREHAVPCVAVQVLRHWGQRNRWSLREWMPRLP